MSQCSVLIAANGVGKSKEVDLLSKGACDRLGFFPKNRHRRAGSFAYVRQTVDRLSISHRISSLIETPLVIGGLSLEEARNRVRTSLQRFGFGDLYTRTLTGLSGGEDQIVHLLAGAVHGSSGLIVDDPFGMLDATRITQAQEMLRLYLAGDYEDGLGRDLVVTIPDSDADLACSISDSIDDSLTIKAVTPVHRRDSLRDFNLGLPHYALSQHGASLCVDKVKLALREGRQIIDGLSFELQPGHVYVLTGENGSGKSLLLKAIAGKLPKAARVTQGRIAFGELRHKGREESLHLARSIIFVPQHCSRLLTTTNPWSVIEDLTTSKTVSLIEHSRRLLDAGILWKVRPVTEASVGQVRFVTHLLAAISAIVRPCVKWILADEPDAYLDSCYQQSLAELFTTVAAAGKGVLLTSHSRNLYPGASEVAIKPYIRAG